MTVLEHLHEFLAAQRRGTDDSDARGVQRPEGMT
jgi:hypothetical protein